MKKIIGFASIVLTSLVLLFVITSCANSTNNNGNQELSNVTSTNPNEPSQTEPSNPDTSDNPGTDENVYYTITFKDYDGTVLQTSNFKKGETPTYNKTNPSRNNDDNYSYTFNGWNPSIETVSKDMVYTATYLSTKNSYTVTWKNWDGTVLEIDYNVEYGKTPIYNGSTPTRQSNQNNNYVFNGWDKIITSVTKDIEYTATFEAVPVSLCVVDFDSKGGSSISSQSVIKGEKAYKPANPTKEGYTFVDWYYQGERWSFIGYTVTENMTLEAKWDINYYNLNLNANNSKAGTISNNSGSHYYNKSITITATTNPGYTFNGWYDGDKQITDKPSYTFTMPAKNLSYTAKFSANTNTKYKVEHYLQNIDNTKYPTTPYEIDNLTGTTDTLTNGSVKTYEGFTSPSTITQKLIKGDESTVIKLYYVRNEYNLTINLCDNKGDIFYDLSGPVKYQEELSFLAPEKEGYTFIGWYEGDNLISDKESCTFNMPSNNVTYKGIFSANTNTKYKVEHYLQNLEDDNYPDIPTYIDNLTGTTNTLTSGSVKAYEGFTSPSITQVNINGNGNTVIKLYYTRDSYSVALNKDIDKAGTITGAGTYKYGKEVTIKAETNEGYTFNGWYKNDELYIEDASFNYTIGAEAVAFEARYTANKYTITIDNQAEGVTISGITSGNQYDFDSQIVLTATNIPSGCTVKWTRSDDVVKGGDTYTFKVPAGNITITTTTATTIIYTREGNKIYFGTYPQTKVTATTENGLASITFDSSTWTSYRYYISSSRSDFMYYKDVDIDNNGTYDYRGVYITQYRPYVCSYSSSIGNTYQDDNGYSTNTIYWFSYDPIEWDILTEYSGKALIIANLILDSRDYYPFSSSESHSHNGGAGYANNYELSAIRMFLNNNFYNTAFNELQKALIKTMGVDNSAASAGQSVSSYACDSTFDKMFLLSRKEATTYYTSSTARQAKGSDYAKCQGLEVYSSNGNSYWWLRSPSDYPGYARSVVYNGSIDYSIDFVNLTRNGVRPACWITI